MTYRDMLRVAAEEQGRPFRMVTVPVLTPTLSSYWLHIVTSVDMRVARPLIDGLRNDVVCRDRRILDLLPGPTLSYREAVRAALHVDASERRSRWLRLPSPATRAGAPAPPAGTTAGRIPRSPGLRHTARDRGALAAGGAELRRISRAMARRPTFCGACAAAPTVCSVARACAAGGRRARSPRVTRSTGGASSAWSAVAPCSWWPRCACPGSRGSSSTSSPRRMARGSCRRRRSPTPGSRRASTGTPSRRSTTGCSASSGRT